MAPLFAHRVPGKPCLGVIGITQALSVPTYSNTDEAFDSPRSMVKREEASGIIILILGDAPLRAVMDVEEDPSRMLQLLDSRYVSNRTA